MKIRIYLVSGQTIDYETDKYETIDSFIRYVTKSVETEKDEDEIILELSEEDIIFFSKIERIRVIK
jgi:hypothetical protein